MENQRNKGCVRVLLSFMDNERADDIRGIVEFVEKEVDCDAIGGGRIKDVDVEGLKVFCRKDTMKDKDALSAFIDVPVGDEFALLSMRFLVGDPSLSSCLHGLLLGAQYAVLDGDVEDTSDVNHVLDATVVVLADRSIKRGHCVALCVRNGPSRRTKRQQRERGKRKGGGKQTDGGLAREPTLSHSRKESVVIRVVRRSLPLSDELLDVRHPVAAAADDVSVVCCVRSVVALVWCVVVCVAFGALLSFYGAG